MRRCRACCRLGYVSREFLVGGQVPSVCEANHKEPMLPWGAFNQGRVVLGSSVAAAFQGPAQFLALSKVYKDQK